jgi:S1-C subfamily serine protease
MSGGNQGIGMAISAKLAKKVVGDLIKQGRVARGYLRPTPGGCAWTAAP